MAALDDVLDLLTAEARRAGVDPDTIDPDELVAALPDDVVEAMLAPILADEDFQRFHKFEALFPDDGPFRRELYPKHVEFFRVGKTFRERCFMAANRVGKTVAGAYEMTCHLTGRYPDWWEGKRFAKPIQAWAAGDTNETTRDIIQLELLGAVVTGDAGRKTMDGSGMVPRDCLGQPKWKQGVQDLVDTIPIRHITGGWSFIGFKSFDQGRRSFQGTAKHVIWLDEECPLDVYGECMMRVATTRGILMTTFTPLSGLSETVLQFLSDDQRPGA